MFQQELNGTSTINKQLCLFPEIREQKKKSKKRTASKRRLELEFYLVTEEKTPQKKLRPNSAFSHSKTDRTIT